MTAVRLKDVVTIQYQNLELLGTPPGALRRWYRGVPVIQGIYVCCGDQCYVGVYATAEIGVYVAGAVHTSGHGERATMAALSGECVCSAAVEEVVTRMGQLL